MIPILLFTIVKFLFSGGVVNSGATCPGIVVASGTIPFNPACFLALPPNLWFPIFFIIVLVSISIIVLIYMLSPFLGRNDIKLWARIKIYELLMTVVLAVVFLGISSALYTTDPTSTLRQVGLLPSTCDPTITTNTPSSYLIVDNIYSVALCDMYQYNADVSTYSTGIFYLAMVAGLSPQVDVNAAALVGGPPQLPTSGAGASASPGLGFSLNFQLVPIQFVLQYIVPLMGAYFAVIILAQVQQILLSSAMIIFSIFMIAGFVARAFSVTKTFGGSMIAFALGIGFVYPLVTLIGYGFIDVVISNTTTSLGGAMLTILFQAAGGLFSAVLQTLTSGCSNPASVACNNTALANSMTPFVILGGFISSGLLFIPLVNLVIVDAFIVDVSKVIGERMDLMSLLTRIV